MYSDKFKKSLDYTERTSIVLSVKAACMICVAATTGSYNKEELKQENPDAIVTNLEQAKALLQNQHFLCK